MSDKQKILDQIGEFNVISDEIARTCRAYCANELIPLEDRWEVFRVAPGKEADSWENFPPFIDSTYDELNLEKYETFDAVERIDQWDEEFKRTGKLPYNFKSNDWTEEHLIEFKNFYLTRYLGSCVNNW